ncbi:carbohydrate ABC transporter permease [Metabacillus endolithicus]|uniref:Carbohydrate ABC transporter permease n=1 Tax=Metabacillus endolithicus TaxID=1535204 RepID=A0ABW5BQC9_9BACI|nr:carbohydrate ABC transporter permease [Metabacillus endolithicus]UPG63798.1 carbohydrate ABC transporter permease [Metabacillus endolithicus]
MRKVFTASGLVAVSLLSIMPFYVLIMMSTQVTEDIFKGKMFSPGNYAFENLATVLNSNFFNSFLNSVFVSVTSTILCVLICTMTGYSLAKYNYKYKALFYAFIVGTMMVPTQIGLIGYIMEMRFFQLNNTLIPLILIWIANPFGVFWMVQYIKTAVPQDIIESARIDGCNELRIFIQIILPIVKPAMVTLSLVIFLWSWNNYLLPLVMINKEELFTIPLSIQSLGNYYRTDYGARMMGLLIAIIPLIILFIFGSKNFIRGLTAGAVKE